VKGFEENWCLPHRGLDSPREIAMAKYAR
jgi:hypothetical protein